MRQPPGLPSRVGSVLAAPLPRFLKAARRRRLGRAVPWPLLSLAGFGALIAVGTILLALPLTAESNEATPLIDAAFTAVSAVTVTGLTVADTADHWNRIGEGLILGLIQLGGLGVMTATTFLLVLIGVRIGIRGRALARDDLAYSGTGSVRRFVLSIVIFVLITEVIGVGLLYLSFASEERPAEAAWQAAFHAVSAFNNAGFDLQGGGAGFIRFHDDPYVLLVVAGLIILGGISFAVVANLLGRTGLKRLPLNAKIVLVGTAALILVGTGLTLSAEHANAGTLGSMPWGGKLLNSFFLSVTARTAGFNTVPVVNLADSTLFLVSLLMFIGAAAGSAGGGIKVNTVSIIAAAVLSSLRGRRANEAFGRHIPDEQLRKALALSFIGLLLVAGGTMALVRMEAIRFIHGQFLIVSAFATVGLATADVSAFADAAKLLLMALMLVGKLGIPVLALLLARLDRAPPFEYPEERVNLG